jgi:hypothetical protein
MKEVIIDKGSSKDKMDRGNNIEIFSFQKYIISLNS